MVAFCACVQASAAAGAISEEAAVVFLAVTSPAKLLLPDAFYCGLPATHAARPDLLRSASSADGSSGRSCWFPLSPMTMLLFLGLPSITMLLSLVSPPLQISMYLMVLLLRAIRIFSAVMSLLFSSRTGCSSYGRAKANSGNRSLEK